MSNMNGNSGLISRKSGRLVFRKTTKWRPKTWKPIHEQIILGHCAGKTNVALAEQYRFTPVHISNIINSPQGTTLRNQIYERLRSATLETIPARLDIITNAAIEICEVVLIKKRDDIIERSPLALLDRSMRLLQGVGKLKSEETKSPVINLSVNTQIALVKGLEKANRARELHTVELLGETT